MDFLFLDSWLRDRAAGSGSAVAIAGLADGLRSLGHSVEILGPRRRFASLDLTRLVFNVGLPRRLEKRRGEFDVVVGFDFDGWALGRSGATLRAQGGRSSYVVALKGVAAEEGKFEAGWHGLRFALLSRLEGRNARSGERVFVTSRYAADAAVQAYGLDPGRVRIAPEGLDREFFQSARGRPGTAPPGPIVLSVARQYRRKDTPTLLVAFALLLDEMPAARLRIVGSGPELAPARRLAERLGIGGSVRFLGSLETAGALRAEYRAARVFCLPSRQEGFGIVFLEAMASGLPIAAVRAGAVPEVAPAGEVSLLTDPGDAPALAASLARLLRDDELARRLGENGVARARRFDWSSTAAAFLEGLAD